MGFRRRAVAGDGEAQLPTKVTDNTAPTMSPGISTTSGGCSMQLEAPGDHAQDEAVNELHVQLGFMPAFSHASVDLTEEDDPHSPIGIALRKSHNLSSQHHLRMRMHYLTSSTMHRL